jgi:hypothetical protein
MPNLDLETAFSLTLTHVYERAYWSIVMERFEDDGTTPENWDVADYEINIALSATLGNKILTLSSKEDDITIVGNVLTIFCDADKNVLKGGRTYYYDMIRDKGDGEINIITKGTIQVQYSVSR